MARAQKLTAADDLAAIEVLIATENAQREALDAERGDAETLIRSFPDRRAEALKLCELGEDRVVPDAAELDRLKGVVAAALEKQNTLRELKPLRAEEKLRVLAAAVPYFDAGAEDGARALELECDELQAKVVGLLARQQAKDLKWRYSREGHRELLGRDEMPGVGFNDLGDVKGKIEDVKLKAWPGQSEARWREFKAREQGQFGGER
jgi:hypothetical protein